MENAGFLRGNAIVDRRVNTAPLKDLLLIAEQSLELTSAAREQPADSIFTHSATESLSGGPHPCASIHCRHRHVEELARFAALYSDRVYIRNNLMGYFAHRDQHSRSTETLRAEIRDDFAILAELRPLIDAGRGVPITPPGDRCPRCLRERGVESEERARMRPALLALEKRFRDGLTITVRRLQHQYQFTLEGPPELLEHTIYRNVDVLPSALETDPRVLRRLGLNSAVSA